MRKGLLLWKILLSLLSCCQEVLLLKDELVAAAAGLRQEK